MSFTGLDVFDSTLQKSNLWLRDLMEDLHWEDRHRTYLALRSTLHTLRDRLTPDEAVQFGAQLPMLIRGMYYDGWRISDRPYKIRDKQEFLSMVHREFLNDPTIDPEQVVRAVFSLLARKISEGEIQDIMNIMPRELQDLWVLQPEQAR